MISLGNWINAAFLALSACMGVYGYLKIPRGTSVAIHFNLKGVADGFAPPMLAFSLIPLVGLTLFGFAAWQIPAVGAGKWSWDVGTITLLIVQVALCFGQFVILTRALRG